MGETDPGGLLAVERRRTPFLVIFAPHFQYEQSTFFSVTMMQNNHTDLVARFPELSDPYGTLSRIAEAFVAPEYARAAFALMRDVARSAGTNARFGLATVVTAPQDYSNLIMTISRWWFLNFHIAEAEALEEGEDVEEIGPDDYENVLDEAAIDDASANGHDHGDDDDDEDDDEEGLVEATFYQVGTFLLDSTIIPHETIFEREEIDCYAYDFPEERISAERFYWARLVWEPEDLANEDLLVALRSSAEFLLANHGEETPFAEHHDADFAQLILDEALCERAIGATDFGDVIVIEGDDLGE